MTTAGYSSRLDALEQDMYEPTHTLWSRTLGLKYYIAIGVVLFFVLLFSPPSFLLTEKHKKIPRRIHWVKWWGAWVLCTVIVGGMYYLYARQ